jgi:hypothetical protein
MEEPVEHTGLYFRKVAYTWYDGTTFSECTQVKYIIKISTAEIVWTWPTICTK